MAREFVEGFKAKYDKGQAEHGGKLWEKDCSTFLVEEVFDFWAYARTIEKQRLEAIGLLRLAATTEAGWTYVSKALQVLEGTNQDHA